MKSAEYIFYAGLLYGEYGPGEVSPHLHTLPDGVYLYFPHDSQKKHWYLKDMTPVLIEDVPKELRLLLLLLT